MGILKSIGMWILKIILSGIGVKVRTEEQAKAEKERDQALAREQAQKDNEKLEDDIAAEIKKAEDAEKAKPSDPADPMGVNDWNKGKQ
jgi:hypothetical protein